MTNIKTTVYMHSAEIGEKYELIDGEMYILETTDVVDQDGNIYNNSGNGTYTKQGTIKNFDWNLAEFDQYEIAL